MTNRYVNSMNGLVGNTGLSWAAAKDTLANAATGAAAGDSIFLADGHVEVGAGAVNLVFAGTPENPVRVICGKTNAAPPDVVATVAPLVRSGSGSSNTLSVAGSVYMYGVSLRAGQGSGSSSSELRISPSAGQAQVYENCVLESAANSTAGMVFGSTSNNSRTSTRLRNTGLKFGSDRQRLTLNNTRLIWEGGKIEFGSETPASLISAGGAQCVDASITGVDFRALGTLFNFVEAGALQPGRILLRNCALPAGWVGGLIAGPIAHPGFRIDMHNCDSGNTVVRVQSEQYGGSIMTTTAARRVGSDDSQRMTTNANSAGFPLESTELFGHVDAVGAPVTIAVDIAHEGAVDLSNAEIWLELIYLASSAVPLAQLSRDTIATPLDTAVPQDASTAAWTGLTAPRKQRLSVTFTAQIAGAVFGRVVLAKPSTVVYVDRHLQEV